jgi:hypothetical protein
LSKVTPGEESVVTSANRFLGCIVFLLLSVVTASAREPGSRTYFNQDIFVAQGQQIHNASCFFCSVQVEGDVTGNVLVLFGNLNISGHVKGRTTVLGGNTVIDSLARIDGNALVIDGNAVYETDESISGNAWVIGGHLSPARNRPRSIHRASFSPVLFPGIALAALLLLSLLFLPRRKSDLA